MQDVVSHLAVLVLVNVIQHDVDQIEPADERRGQVDVLDHTEELVILGLDGVGGGEDCGARVEVADDARLGDADGLLLHHLVQHAAAAHAHLVELVDAADAAVGQDECS